MGCRRSLFLMLGAALTVRVAWVLAQPSDPAAMARLPDQVGYLELAKNLLAGEGLTYFEPRFNEPVRAMRLPGYPLFLAACGASTTAARVAQSLIDTSSVLGVYLLARRWLDERRSLFAAAMVAVNPFLIYFCGLILTETLFTAMLVWGMVLLAHRREFLSGGLLLALSVMVRPSAMLLPLALGIAGVIANRERDAAYQPRRWPLPVGATMILLTGLILLPWAVRNRVVLGQWLWTTTNDGLTAYDGFNPDATGASDQSFVQRMPWLRSPTMDELERSRYLSELAGQYIRENPRRVIELAGVKIARTWSPIPLSREYGTNPLYLAAGLIYGVPFLALFVIGLCRGRLGGAPKMYLALPAVYFTLVHAASVGSLRYRIPAEAPMAVIAASVSMMHKSESKLASRRDASDSCCE